MTNKELTQIRESLSLTKKEFAERIGTTAMMIGRYEKGNTEIPDYVATAAIALVKPAEEDVAFFIKGVRESLDISKSAFAKLIGVSATMAGNYESGKNKPKDEVIARIKSLIKEEAAPAASAPVDEEEAASAAPVDEKEEVAVPAEEKSEEPASAPAEEKAEEPAPAKKKAEEPAPVDEKKTVSIVIESLMGGSITTEEILSRIPDGVERVYVKPEENAAYWVKGDASGVVNLW